MKGKSTQIVAQTIKNSFPKKSLITKTDSNQRDG